ncbi:SmORF protein [Babesia bovis T2Bo]|uniref:SmORF n=1 Tax=Babesia bovis TaxID=5865 RepID=A7AM52_BABBO|nr:SmORF protein [Babesia bovis T2Bo]EDO07636.1 SmORF protein [Babesia bovis T2Bo]|eukprot:XP_001611204.1 SmORF [Babesia bovis]
MVASNMLWKLSVVVAFGFSATATSTEVAQEQPKKESFVSRFFGKKEEPTTKPEEVSKSDNVETQEDTETEEPPKYSVEWFLLPKPENRKILRYRLPLELAQCVPKSCNKTILPVVEKRIREFFSLSEKDQRSRRLHSDTFTI